VEVYAVEGLTLVVAPLSAARLSGDPA